MRKDQPWLEDASAVKAILAKLPEQVALMFFLGNRSGLRTGEICGLRMSDLGFLDEGLLRVRFSYDGPLKEDKNSDGKVKWAPAPADAKPVLSAWLERRRTDGAKAEDLVFQGPTGGLVNKAYLKRAWDEAKVEANVSLTWYQATRHSFSSSKLARGASLDEVSAAIGHSSPVVTRRYYDHFIRKQFSSVMHEPLDLPQRDGDGQGDPTKPRTS